MKYFEDSCNGQRMTPKAVYDTAYLESLINRPISDAELVELKMILRMAMDGEKAQKDSTIEIDTFGSDCFFARDFVNEEMFRDFYFIARDFYKHEISNIPNYPRKMYVNLEADDLTPDRYFIKFVINLIINAIKGGSNYSKALVLYLYKTYYKKEYNAIKRFDTISFDIVMKFALPLKGERFSNTVASRILFISELLGYRIKFDCYGIYEYLNTFYHVMIFYPNLPAFSYNEEFFNQGKNRTCNQPQERIGNAMDFLSNVLSMQGYTPFLVRETDVNHEDLNGCHAETFAVLRTMYPHKSFSYEQLELYSMILHSVSALTCNIAMNKKLLDIFSYGEQGIVGNYNQKNRFNPNDISYAEKSIRSDNNEKVEDKLSSDGDNERNNMTQKDEDMYVDELDKLREKISKLEEDNNNLRNKLSSLKIVEEKYSIEKEKNEAINAEAAVLRNYVYNLTERDANTDELSVDKMKDVVAKYRIIIIGGHSNWVNKMKKEFPNWSYVNPSASGSTDVSIVDKADFVYFFTDTISHTRYYQFLGVIRSRNVKFGYLHGVNIHNNIRNIYRDLRDGC